MALQVWIPGTNGINDQGLNNTTIDNRNVIIDNNGKIGRCLSFNTNSYFIGSPGPLNNITDWTYACWMKVNSSHNGALFSERINTSATGIMILYYSGKFMFDDGSRWTFTPQINIELDTWYHLCFVSKKNSGKYCYINGVLDTYTTNGASATTVSTNYYIVGSVQTNATGESDATSYKFDGCLNDIRIYNHALSAKEVHLLSQGLVAHYPLNREGFGNENLVTNSLDVITSKIYYSTTTELGTKDAAYVSIINTILPEGSLAEGDMLSVQFNYEVFGNTKSNAYIYTQICGSAGQAYPDVETNSTSLYVGDKPKGLFAMTYRVNATQASVSGVPRVRMRLRAATDGAYFKMWNLHVERGLKTPWVPCSEDNLYQAMGLDNGIIYDVSGYSNNITEVENISYTPDTPKYNMAAQFAANTHGAFIHPFVNGVLLEEATFSYWAKREVEITDESYMCSGLVQLYLYQNVARIRWYARNEDGSYDENNTWNSGFVIPENEWILITFVFKDSYMNLYINGEYKTRSKRQKYIRTNKGTRFGASTSTGTNGLPCKVSDFRIYTTALSADDIMELYNSPISLANTGVLLTSGEFVEVY